MRGLRVRQALVVACCVLLVQFVSTLFVLCLSPGWLDLHYVSVPLASVVVLLGVGLLVVWRWPTVWSAVAVGLAVGGGAANLVEAACGWPVLDWLRVAGYVWDLADWALLCSVAPLVVGLVVDRGSLR